MQTTIGKTRAKKAQNNALLAAGFLVFGILWSYGLACLARPYMDLPTSTTAGTTYTYAVIVP